MADFDEMLATRNASLQQAIGVATAATADTKDATKKALDVVAAGAQTIDARDQAAASAAAAAATVPTVGADLDGVPWIHYEGLTLTGAAAGLAWTDPMRTVARAIKHVLLEGAVSAAETYYFSTFCYEDGTFGDQIIVRRLSDNAQVAVSGTAVVAKNAAGPTELSFTGGGIRFRLLVDYRELAKGILINKATVTPLLISRAVSPVEQDRTNRHEQLRGSLWLEPDASALTGVAAGYLWEAGSRTLARAIKDVALSGLDPLRRYRIFQVANAHVGGTGDPAQGDRIRIVDETTQLSVIDTAAGATVTRNPSGVTRVDVTGASVSGSLYIDYRELAAGVNYQAQAPLILARQSVMEVIARRDALPRRRNIAFDGALAKGGTGTVWNAVGSGFSATGSAVAANAELAANGITSAYIIGSANNAVTALYKREPAPARAGGRLVYASVYVTSADGVAFPSSEISVFPYTAAVGGAIVAGRQRLAAGFEQITPTKRRMWCIYRMPASQSILGLAVGLDKLAEGNGQLGGWTMAVSSSDIRDGSVELDDWTGTSTRDQWRDDVDASIATLQAGATNYPYNNAFVNGNADTSGADPTLIVVTGARSIVAAPAALATRGIKRVVNVGTGGGQAFTNDQLLDASARAQPAFASTYIYSADGATWPAMRAYVYSGGTGAGNYAMSFLQIDANVRLYYVSFTLPDVDTLTNLRIGPNADMSGSGVVIQMGGFSFFRYATGPLTLANTPRDDWYGRYAKPEALAAVSRKVDAGIAGGSFAGETWVMSGDSITDSFGVPDQVALLTGATVVNCGFGGCRWTPGTSTTGMNGAQAQFSMVRLALAIATGDWSAQIQAAADAYALDATYDKRAKVAALAALDWSKVTRMTLDWGTNDWSAGRALGAPNSTAENEVNGAINLTIARILGKYPAMQLVLITPWWRGPNATLGDSNVNPNANGVYLRDMQDAIIERGRYQQTPVIRMHELIGINLANKATFLGDDLHPTNPAGRNRKAKVITNQMRLLAA